MAEDRRPQDRERGEWDDLDAEGAALPGRRSQPGKSRRRRRWPYAVAASLALVGVGIGAWIFYGPRWSGRSGGEMLGLRLSSSETATLYFADPRWTKLVAEGRQLQPRADAVARMRALVEALAAGPRGDAVAVLPKETRLRAAYVGKDGLAVLDLEPWPEGTELGGVSGELLAVFSLVQTVAQNVSGIRTVQILVGGEERETLAGHVKISEPLYPEAPASTPAR